MTYKDWNRHHRRCPHCRTFHRQEFFDSILCLECGFLLDKPRRDLYRNNRPRDLGDPRKDELRLLDRATWRCK